MFFILYSSIYNLHLINMKHFMNNSDAEKNIKDEHPSYIVIIEKLRF